MTSSARWDQLLKILQGASYVAVVLGIVFAAIEYLSARETGRVANALTFIEAFYDSDMTDARLQLQQRWLNVPLQRFAGLSGSREVVDELATAQILEGDSREDLARLTSIIDYLNVVATCASEGICEKRVVDLHLAQYARSLFCLYRAPILILQEEYELEHFGLQARDYFSVQSHCIE